MRHLKQKALAKKLKAKTNLKKKHKEHFCDSDSDSDASISSVDSDIEEKTAFVGKVLNNKYIPLLDSIDNLENPIPPMLFMSLEDEPALGLTRARNYYFKNTSELTDDVNLYVSHTPFLGFWYQSVPF